MHVLIATDVHDIFTLHEILHWVAFGGLPIGDDSYFDDDIFGNPRTTYPEELYLGKYGDGETKLMPYPDYPEYPSPEVLKHIPNLHKDFKQRALEVHAEYAKAVIQWEATHDEVTETAKAEIFLALKQGRLKLRGVLARKLSPNAPVNAWKSEDGDMWEGDVPPIPEYPYPSPRQSMDAAMQSGNIDEFECLSCATDWKMGLHMRHRFEARLSDIPAQLWRQEGIDWESCQARTPEGWFEDIVGTSANIFECFPLPSKESLTLEKCAGYLLESGKKQDALHLQKRGRPPLIDWHAFDVEVARAISNDGLPSKQEAFISAMQEWCFEKWGTHPKRSTVLQRVSPFYQISKVKK
ncbi:MAG: hypothetical protein DI585_01855 [Pseudomonas fluorescens]|nr:MAG: hypothetical protein DI585_01855 [Pseudomonas fluorescens]